MTMRTLGMCAFGVLLAACSTPGGHAGNGPAGGSSGGSSGGSGSGSGSSSGTGSSSGSSSGATTDGGLAMSDGGAGILSATLQNTGRHGDVILFTISGADPNGETSEIHAKLLDKSGAPVTAFDTNWDGIADSAEMRLHFDQSTLGQTTFTQTVTLPGLYTSAPSIASAVVSLSDVNGNLSSPMTISLQTQIEAKLGSACDPNEMTIRCQQGLGCSGTPAVCVAGVAPTLTNVGYFSGSNPSQVFLGTDPDEDLATITINFLDPNGKTMAIDVDGDGDMASSALVNASSAAGTSFVYENDPTANFAGAVTKISATPADLNGNVGNTVVATATALPVRTNGQTCDPRGFTACQSGFACSPGIASETNECVSVGNLQGKKCTGAPEAASGVLAGWGIAQGPSLWDPPAGCALPTSVNQPEGAVTLKLAQSVAHLTISTATPETNFDTVLYVLPGCAADSSQALGCNDDTQGYTSTVQLDNVSAGTYTVVVDSQSRLGGQFGLTVTATP